MFPSTRLRRLRRNAALRHLTQETYLHPHQFIYPIFVDENLKENKAIASLPGQYRIAEAVLPQYLQQLYAEGIRAVLLFGIPKKKDADGLLSLEKEGFLARIIHNAKTATPEMLIISDNCFCEYTQSGDCGVTRKGCVDNDLTLKNLAQQAVLCAQAGADIVAPSAMMDGQVQAIRKALDKEGLYETPIMAYSTKFCSSFYSPFREAVDSHFLGHRASYQIPFPNSKEALYESALDEAEGADFLMVKPAGLNLDILHQISTQTQLPVVAYQVSGEYASLQFAAQAGVLDIDAAMVESLTCIKRAGARVIITYFARALIKLLEEQGNHV